VAEQVEKRSPFLLRRTEHKFARISLVPRRPAVNVYGEE
jgi:hypothetical protein